MTQRLGDDRTAYMSRWLSVVVPQLGVSADFAQVDIDTLFDLDRDAQGRLADIAMLLFESALTDLDERDESLCLRLTIPLGPGLPPGDPDPDSAVFEMLQYADFRGSLRGRPVPGFAVSAQAPGDLSGAARTHFVRLAAKPGVAASVVFRRDEWIDRKADGAWITCAVEFTHYPSTRPPVEARFDALPGV